ncbi:RNA ligase/cyclic nucleotide phosphodiesterase [Massariosphaeria phaeospora]|uniref:RNA ligase/cyclic nucleotide phosphodiesterase n=1 Tax=Massariosphaeria phaeospora TaxID=100035 RepID=A0A7C8MIT0_9PLEO|nr:RNA ligase/cyclic nucleotide phosphodiesterase [Massariosphaeria phaeospora]
MSTKTTLPAQRADAFEDLSGTSTSAFSNPYEALVAACQDDPVQIQARYTVHRTTRNAQQKARMLDQSFPGVIIDQILLRLSDPEIEPGYVDPRHCLVFWGRPTQKIKDLISRIQLELLTVAPNLWLMPQQRLHITALELTHSKKAEGIDQLVKTLGDKIAEITDHTFEHRTRLIRPMVSFDASALALSFVPAAGEGLRVGRTLEHDRFTYHHLRRNLYDLCRDTGVEVDSRYVVPSSHLTIGRFIYASDFADEEGSPDPGKMEAFVGTIEGINAWLKRDFWPDEYDGGIPDGGEWIVGEEKGLDCRTGTLWYGGGDSVRLGKGF